MPEDEPVSFGAAQWNVPPRRPNPSGAPAPAALIDRLKGPAGRVPDQINDDALGAFMYASRVSGGALRVTSGRGGMHMR